MRLPRGDRAIVDLRKLEDYVLSPARWRGQHKARMFAAVLGMTAADADELRSALLYAAETGDALSTDADAFGQRYVIDFELLRANGRRARIRSAWIVRSDEETPRFVTCYVL
jgi:hypothetical protein